MNRVTIARPRQGVQHGWPAVSAVITAEDRCYEIFYAASQGPLDIGVSPFVAAGLLAAMRLGVPLHVDGVLSARQLRRIDQFQKTISAWYNDFRRVPIDVREVASPPMSATAARGVGSFFSGGVDSFYTALTHLDELKLLIFVHGFDIPLTRQAQRNQASRALHSAAAELGKPLVEVETNVRSLLDVYTDWLDHSHGAALSAVGLLLSPQISVALIASTLNFRLLRPLGSHPILDPLWGKEDLDVFYDGGETSRMNKVRWLASSETALRWLRVCWEQTDDSYNCGRCSKCLRVMAILDMIDALRCCRTLPYPLDLDAVANVPLHEGTVITTDLIAREAERLGKQALAQALRQALARATAVTNVAATESDVVRSLQGRVAHLERELELLQGSASWRLTAPMRDVVAVLRGIGRREGE